MKVTQLHLVTKLRQTGRRVSRQLETTSQQRGRNRTHPADKMKTTTSKRTRCWVTAHDGTAGKATRAQWLVKAPAVCVTAALGEGRRGQAPERKRCGKQQPCRAGELDKPQTRGPKDLAICPKTPPQRHNEDIFRCKKLRTQLPAHLHRDTWTSFRQEVDAATADACQLRLRSAGGGLLPLEDVTDPLNDPNKENLCGRDRRASTSLRAACSDALQTQQVTAAQGRGLPRGLPAPWLARRASREVTATSLKPASIHQENATILSTYAADNRASTFTKQNCKETDKPQPSGRLHEVLAVAEPTSFSSAHGAFIQTHLTLDIKQASVKLACRLQRGRTQCGVAASERENRSPLWTPFLHTPPGGGDEQPQTPAQELAAAFTQLLLSYTPSRKSESCSQPSCPRTGARQRQTHRGIPLSNEKEAGQRNHKGTQKPGGVLGTVFKRPLPPMVTPPSACPQSTTRDTPNTDTAHTHTSSPACPNDVPHSGPLPSIPSRTKHCRVVPMLTHQHQNRGCKVGLSNGSVCTSAELHYSGLRSPPSLLVSTSVPHSVALTVPRLANRCRFKLAPVSSGLVPLDSPSLPAPPWDLSSSGEGVILEAPIRVLGCHRLQALSVSVVFPSWSPRLPGRRALLGCNWNLTGLRAALGDDILLITTCPRSRGHCLQVGRQGAEEPQLLCRASTWKWVTMHLGFSFLSTKSTLGSHLTSKSMSFEPPSQLHTQGFQSLEDEAVELTFQSRPRRPGGCSVSGVRGTEGQEEDGGRQAGEDMGRSRPVRQGIKLLPPPQHTSHMVAPAYRQRQSTSRKRRVQLYESSVLIRVRGAQWGNKGKVGKGLALGLRHHPWQGAGRGSAQVPEAVRGCEIGAQATCSPGGALSAEQGFHAGLLRTQGPLGKGLRGGAPAHPLWASSTCLLLPGVPLSQDANCSNCVRITRLRSPVHVQAGVLSGEAAGAPGLHSMLSSRTPSIFRVPREIGLNHAAPLGIGLDREGSMDRRREEAEAGAGLSVMRDPGSQLPILLPLPGPSSGCWVAVCSKDQNPPPLRLPETSARASPHSSGQCRDGVDVWKRGRGCACLMPGSATQLLPLSLVCGGWRGLHEPLAILPSVFPSPISDQILCPKNATPPPIPPLPPRKAHTPAHLVCGVSPQPFSDLCESAEEVGTLCAPLPTSGGKTTPTDDKHTAASGRAKPTFTSHPWIERGRAASMQEEGGVCPLLDPSPCSWTKGDSAPGLEGGDSAAGPALPLATDMLTRPLPNSNEAKDNVGPTGALTSCRWGRHRAKPPQDVSLRTPQAKHCPGHETQPPSQTGVVKAPLLRAEHWKAATAQHQEGCSRRQKSLQTARKPQNYRCQHERTSGAQWVKEDSRSTHPARLYHGRHGPHCPSALMVHLAPPTRHPWTSWKRRMLRSPLHPKQTEAISYKATLRVFPQPVHRLLLGGLGHLLQRGLVQDTEAARAGKQPAEAALYPLPHPCTLRMGNVSLGLGPRGVLLPPSCSWGLWGPLQIPDTHELRTFSGAMNCCAAETRRDQGEWLLPLHRRPRASPTLAGVLSHKGLLSPPTSTVGLDRQQLRTWSEDFWEGIRIAKSRQPLGLTVHSVWIKTRAATLLPRSRQLPAGVAWEPQGSSSNLCSFLTRNVRLMMLAAHNCVAENTPACVNVLLTIPDTSGPSAAALSSSALQGHHQRQLWALSFLLHAISNNHLQGSPELSTEGVMSREVSRQSRPSPLCRHRTSSRNTAYQDGRRHVGRPGEQVILYVLKQGFQTGSDGCLGTFLIIPTGGRGAADPEDAAPPPSFASADSSPSSDAQLLSSHTCCPSEHMRLLGQNVCSARHQAPPQHPGHIQKPVDGCWRAITLTHPALGTRGAKERPSCVPFENTRDTQDRRNQTTPRQQTHITSPPFPPDERANTGSEDKLSFRKVLRAPLQTMKVPRGGSDSNSSQRGNSTARLHTRSPVPRDSSRPCGPGLGLLSSLGSGMGTPFRTLLCLQDSEAPNKTPSCSISQTMSVSGEFQESDSDMGMGTLWYQVPLGPRGGVPESGQDLSWEGSQRPLSSSPCLTQETVGMTEVAREDQQCVQASRIVLEGSHPLGDRPCGSLWRTLTFSGLNQPLQPVGQPWIHPSKARPWRAPEQHIPHAPFLHAASTGLWACEPFSSGKAGFLMHTHLASVHPRPCGPGTELCAALNRPGASQGGLFPTTWQELSLTHHGPGQAQGGPAHLSLPEDKDITGPGLGSTLPSQGDSPYWAKQPGQSSATQPLSELGGETCRLFHEGVVGMNGFPEDRQKKAGKHQNSSSLQESCPLGFTRSGNAQEQERNPERQPLPASLDPKPVISAGGSMGITAI
ncbi:Protein lin-28-like protein A [Camelus dromedarius]|uniref:Protein lin-28-like protein A n=1 Tax=Camelus dromedarius TaxID=9838 RepID=A0A5N4D6F5_CAMDR|nr:Protein lin-28-like protein A [Camelus dromedarius]